MAIKIGGTSIINDDGSISNVGIVTVGTGGTDGKVQVGTGATIYGSGDVAVAGTIYAFDLVVPLKIDSFSPGLGEENVSIDTDIRISFNKSISIGSTGFVYINGPNSNLDTFSIGSTYISRADVNKTLVITPTAPFAKGVLGAANTITTVVDASFIDDPAFTGITTTGSAITYQFEIENIAYGDPYEGGTFVCASGGTQWIVAPCSAEVSRNWYLRGDAVTAAEAIAPCGDWFVPSCGQLQNPGATCRTYWDCSPRWYWSNTEFAQWGAWIVNMDTGATGRLTSPHCDKPRTNCIRAFRCVTY